MRLVGATATPCCPNPARSATAPRTSFTGRPFSVSRTRGNGAASVPQPHDAHDTQYQAAQDLLRIYDFFHLFISGTLQSVSRSLALVLAWVWNLDLGTDTRFTRAPSGPSIDHLVSTRACPQTEPKAKILAKYYRSLCTHANSVRCVQMANPFICYILMQAPSPALGGSMVVDAFP